MQCNKMPLDLPYFKKMGFLKGEGRRQLLRKSTIKGRDITFP